MISEDISRAYKKAKGDLKGDGTFEGALRTSNQLSEAMARAINTAVPGGVKLDDLQAGLEDGFDELYEDSLSIARYAQEEHNRQAGLGLKPVDMKVDTYRSHGLAKKVAEDHSMQDEMELTPEEIAQLQNLANSAVDQTIKKNAEFQSKSGVEVTVTRYYDGVGLREGSCKWCEDREGRDVPYQEALARGMFQRHPGCGCSLTYKSGHRKYHQADWTKNSWADTNDTLEMRKKYGL